MACTLKFWGTLILAVLLTAQGICQTHGLQFSSHEVVPEKRTGLNLTPGQPVCFEKSGEIEFDFKFLPNLETYFGYIVRIIADNEAPAAGRNTANDGNIDIVYNQILRNFNFVTGEVSQVFELDSATLHNKWNSIRIRFDQERNRVLLYVNGQLRGEKKLLGTRQLCLRIFFGANDHEIYQTVDLPPMQIKNIRIKEDSRLKQSFPLAESKGQRALDEVTGASASIRNAVWVQAKHQHWDEVSSFTTTGVASVGFDVSKEILYVISRDSIYSMSVKNNELSGEALLQSRKILPYGNQSVFHSERNELVNFYIDEKQVSTLTPGTLRWNLNFSPQLLTEYWHVNKFISPIDSSLYVVAGYGQLRYKNSIFRYHFPTNTWDTIYPTGDFFMPRYLSALGLNAQKDTAYILGGYGSNTGDQKINPRHTYELLAYSIRSKTFKTLQQLREPSKHFAFSNSLITDSATRYFYTLVYPRDRYNSSLQILKGSLDSTSYQLVGDTIAYPFHDIESFADLFYAPSSKKLIAVTLFTGKDSISAVKIYTLNFPPNEPAILRGSTDHDKSETAYAVAAIIVAGVLIFLVGRKLIQRKKNSAVRVYPDGAADISIPQRPPATVSTRDPGTMGSPMSNPSSQSLANSSGETLLGHTNADVLPVQDSGDDLTADTGLQTGPAIFLFGQFQVIDVQGHDITKQFTPLLKELFLLILINTYRDKQGVSSEALTEMLWHNKSEKDAKNNRSVNIAKLKAVIEKLGTPVITKESGLWQFQVNDGSVYIDFADFNQLLALPAKVDRAYVAKLLHIARRGTFLSQTDYNWLDDVKSTVSNTVIDRLIAYLEKASIQEEAEFVIEICNAIFQFDRLNEQALEFKCKSLIILKRHALSNITYLNFTREYKEIYEDDFARSFSEIIK